MIRRSIPSKVNPWSPLLIGLLAFSFAVEAAPVAKPLTITTQEDSPVVITLQGSSKPESITGFRIVSLPRVGRLHQAYDSTPDELITKTPASVLNGDGAVIYVPPPDAFGTSLAVFQYGADVNEVKSRSVMVRINVTPVNDAPVAETDEVLVSPDKVTASIAVLVNDRDIDGNPLRIESFTQPATGSVSLNKNGTLRFVPNDLAGSRQVDQFAYTISDGRGGQATTSVSLIYDAKIMRAWSMAGNDAGHTGSTKVRLGNDSYTESWSLHIKDGALDPVSVALGQVFVSESYYFSAAPSLQAVNLNTGTLNWRHEFEQAFSLTGAAYHGGRLFIQRGNHGEDTQLWCLDAFLGSPVWSAPFSAQWENYLPPTVAGSSVFINGGYYGGMYGFQKSTGVRNFFQDLPQVSGWTPTVVGGRVLSFVEGVFREHHAVTGSVLWSLDLGSSWNYFNNPMVAAAGQMAWMTTFNADDVGGRSLVAVNLSTRKQAWRVPGSFVSGMPAVSNGVVYVIAESYDDPFSTEVHSYDALTGRRLSTFPTPNLASSFQPVITADRLIASGTGGTFLFDLKAGHLVQRLDHGGIISVVDNRIVIAGSDGVLRCYATPQEGNEPPLAQALSATGPEDVDLILALQGTDRNGDPLTAVVRSLPAHGTLYQTVDGTTAGEPITQVPVVVTHSEGKVLYRPVPNQHGMNVASVQFRLFDGKDLSADEAAVIHLTPVNDAPVAEDDVLDVIAGQTIEKFYPLGNDFDVDGDAMSLVSFTSASPLVITRNSDDSLKIVCPPGLAVGSQITFDYTVRDLSGSLSTGQVVVAVVLLSDSEQWATMGRDAAHTGFYARPLGTSALVERWRISTEQAPSPLAVAEGAVFATLGGYFQAGACLALDINTGAEVWHAPVAVSYAINAPTYFDGTVYFQRGKGTSDSPELLAYHAGDGTQKWSAPFAAQWETYLAPAVSEAGVYVSGGTYGGIYGFNKDTGAQKFFLGLEQVSAWTPALTDGQVFSFTGTFRHHQPTTGQVLASNHLGYATGYRLDRTMALARGRAFLVNYRDQYSGANRELVCLDADSATVLWRVPGDFNGTPAVTNQIVYANCGSQVKAFAASTGLLLASYGNASTGSLAMTRHLAITSDLVICGDSTQTYLYDRHSSALVQSIPVAGYAAVGYGSVFISGDDKTIRRYAAPAPSGNHAPVALAGLLSTQEDVSLALQLAASDEDGDALVLVVRSLPTSGSLYQTADGSTKGPLIARVNTRITHPKGRLIYQPADNASGSGLGSFIFTAHDQSSASAVQTFVIHVTPVNDPPVARADKRSLQPGQILSPLDVLANDSDVESDTLSIASFTQPALGTVSLNGTGTLRYEPLLGSPTGEDSFTYTISDGHGGTSSATVTLLISSQSAGWTGHGGSAAHAGYASTTMASGNWARLWTYPASGVAGVAVAESKVFATFNNTEVLALSLSAGSKLWQTSIPGAANQAINPPAWHNGHVYVVQGLNSSTGLVSLSSNTGAQLWRVPATNPFGQTGRSLAPAVSNLGIYINAGTYGGLQGFSADSSQRFSNSMSLPLTVSWTPTIYEGALYTFTNGVFRQHNTSTGATVRQAIVPGSAAFESSMHRSLACADGLAVAVHYGSPSALVAFDLASHTLKWSYTGNFLGTPAIHNGSIFVMTTAGVKEHSAADGSLLGTYASSFSSYVAAIQPIVTDDLVLFSAYNSIRIFNRHTRALVQTISNISGNIAFADNRLIVSNSDGIIAYGPPPGITFSPRGGTFTSAQMVTMTASTGYSLIRYTTDGTAPTLSSPLVTSGNSIVISQTSLLRAIAVSGTFVSGIEEANFTINANAASQLSTTAPMIVALASGSSMRRQTGGSFPTEQTSPSLSQGVELHIESRRVSWPSQKDALYSVEYSTDLTNWILLCEDLRGTGEEMFCDVPVQDENFFFQVREISAPMAESPTGQ